MKLTKKQFRDKFADTKVYVHGKSEDIQRQLFKNGIEWPYSGCKICHTDEPFLFIGLIDTDSPMEIGYSDSMTFFIEHQYKEVTADEILSIEIVDEPIKHEFKPFDKVVVRDYDSKQWFATFFSHLEGDIYNGGHFARCINGEGYTECLPFNDRTAKLIGTKDDYKEEQS